MLHQRDRLLVVDSQRLLDENMATRVQGLAGQRDVRLWRGHHVHHVRPQFLEQPGEVVEAAIEKREASCSAISGSRSHAPTTRAKCGSLAISSTCWSATLPQPTIATLRSSSAFDGQRPRGPAPRVPRRSANLAQAMSCGYNSVASIVAVIASIIDGDL